MKTFAPAAFLFLVSLSSTLTLGCSSAEPDDESESTEDALKTRKKDPFRPSSCSGPTISREALAELTENGTLSYLPKGTMWTRQRSCNDALGCGPWGTPRILGGEAGTASVHQIAYGPKLVFSLQERLVEDAPLPVNTYESYLFKFVLTPGEPTSLLEQPYAHHETSQTSSWDVEDASVVMTDHCLRARAMLFVSRAGSRALERELVFLLRY